MTRAALLLVSIAAASASIAAQTGTMRPGRYEVTSQFAIGGRSTNTPPRTEMVCVSPEDLKDWSRNLVKTAEGTTCKLSEYKTAGPHLTFVRACTNRDGKTTTYTGDVTFEPPDSYHGSVKIAGSNPASPLSGSTITMSAKRLGDCAKP